MKSVLFRTLASAFAIACAAGATQARAHPHVFAEASLEVAVDDNETVSSLRHVWRFDDLFSATVMLEFDTNADLVLDNDELEAVGKVIHESLGEFDYFQVVSAGGKPVEMAAPERIMADYQDNQLLILFETRPSRPLTLDGAVDFGVYDPTFYTAIDFIEDDNLVVTGLPESCSRTVVRPNPDEAIAQNQEKLTEAFFNDPTGVDYSKIFATRLELTCQGQP